MSFPVSPFHSCPLPSFSSFPYTLFLPSIHSSSMTPLGHCHLSNDQQLLMPIPLCLTKQNNGTSKKAKFTPIGSGETGHEAITIPFWSFSSIHAVGGKPSLLRELQNHYHLAFRLLHCINMKNSLQAFLLCFQCYRARKSKHNKSPLD